MVDLRGETPESWCCVDCEINTHPSAPTRIEAERTFNGAALMMEPPSFDITFDERCEIFG